MIFIRRNIYTRKRENTIQNIVRIKEGLVQLKLINAFSSVINRAYLLILILKKIMCIYIYKLLIEKKQMHK